MKKTVPVSVARNVKLHAMKMPLGEPFANTSFFRLGSRSAVDKALSRLVEEGVIQRVVRGVFVRPKKNRFIGNVMPEVARIIETIAKDHGETLQIHGAEAARRFKLSTQMPTTPVYYTNGPGREIHIGNLKVKLIHTTSSRRLQHAGKKPGLALSALWYLGKNNINAEAIRRIQEGLSPKEFEILRTSKMPAWMAEAINDHTQGESHDQLLSGSAGG